MVTTPRARVDTKKIVRQHIKLRGAASLRRLVLPLIVVALINARIVRTTTYHFLNRDQVCELLGTDAVRLTYSDQVWLAAC